MPRDPDPDPHGSCWSAQGAGADLPRQNPSAGPRPARGSTAAACAAVVDGPAVVAVMVDRVPARDELEPDGARPACGSEAGVEDSA